MLVVVTLSMRDEEINRGYQLGGWLSYLPPRPAPRSVPTYFRVNRRTEGMWWLGGVGARTRVVALAVMVAVTVVRGDSPGAGRR